MSNTTIAEGTVTANKYTNSPSQSDTVSIDIPTEYEYIRVKASGTTTWSTTVTGYEACHIGLSTDGVVTGNVCYKDKDSNIVWGSLSGITWNRFTKVDLLIHQFSNMSIVTLGNTFTWYNGSETSLSTYYYINAIVTAPINAISVTKYNTSTTYASASYSIIGYKYG